MEYGDFLVLLESLQPSYLIEFIPKISELSCDFGMDFIIGKFKQIAKVGFRRKN